jgi:PatG C-terminal
MCTWNVRRGYSVRQAAVFGTCDLSARSVLGVHGARRSALNGTRNIVDAIFSYTGRTTDFTEKFSVRVDVSEGFPFLVTKMSPYYDR